MITLNRLEARITDEHVGDGVEPRPLQLVTSLKNERWPGTDSTQVRMEQRSDLAHAKSSSDVS